MKNDVVKLISAVNSYDSDGFPVKTFEEFECMASVNSAKRTEFYQAEMAGQKVVLNADIAEVDYFCACKNARKPTRLLFDDTMYLIHRVYRDKIKKAVSLSLIEVEGNEL